MKSKEEFLGKFVHDFVERYFDDIMQSNEPLREFLYEHCSFEDASKGYFDAHISDVYLFYANGGSSFHYDLSLNRFRKELLIGIRKELVARIDVLINAYKRDLKEVENSLPTYDLTNPDDNMVFLDELLDLNFLHNRLINLYRLKAYVYAV